MSPPTAKPLYGGWGAPQVASWFQGTSAALKSSIFLDDVARAALGVPADLVPYFRARANAKTKEAWFAGYVPQPDGTRTVSLKLPAKAGTLTNLATGEKVAVRDGTCALTLTERARPYHFAPQQPPRHNTTP